jgi:hypothetical protein
MEQIKRFDIVKIKTIKNVNWVSGPAGRPASPKGNWSVMAAVDDDYMIVKDQTVIRIPKNDVALVIEYDLDKAIDSIKKKRIKHS